MSGSHRVLNIKLRISWVAIVLLELVYVLLHLAIIREYKKYTNLKLNGMLHHLLGRGVILSLQNCGAPALDLVHEAIQALKPRREQSIAPLKQKFLYKYFWVTLNWLNQDVATYSSQIDCLTPRWYSATVRSRSNKAASRSPSHDWGSCLYWIRLQSKESKGEETSDSEDGQINGRIRFVFNKYFYHVVCYALVQQGII